MSHPIPTYRLIRNRTSNAVITLVLLALAVLLTDTVLADDDTMSRPAVRSDSLELPGLTAGCHMCEWRPKLNQRPASTECGIDDAGQPRAGLFECGYSPDCERVCNFLSCADR